MKKLLVLIILTSLYAGAQDKQDAFIAMEYRGMLNLIYKVYVYPDKLIGVRVNGYITVPGSMGMGYVVPKPLLNDPNAYVDPNLSNKYARIDMDDTDKVVAIDNENFVILKTEIKAVEHSKKKKFGMGYYPYSGRIIMQCPLTKSNKRKERDFILVGKQDWEKILQLIKKQN